MGVAVREITPVTTGLITDSFRFCCQLDGYPRGWIEVPMFSVDDYDEGDQVTTRGYDFLLPRYNDKNVVGWIDEHVKTLEKDERFRILDVGCWNGWPLLQCATTERWKGKLELSGITANIFPGKIEHYRDLGLGINIVVADAHDLSLVFLGQKFDLIMSSGSLCLMDDQKNVLEEIWQCLALGGLALVNSIYWDKRKEGQLKELNRWLEGKKFDVKFTQPKFVEIINGEVDRVFNYWQATMRKNKEEPLSLPWAYDCRMRNTRRYPPIWTYSFFS